MSMVLVGREKRALGWLSMAVRCLLMASSAAGTSANAAPLAEIAARSYHPHTLRRILGHSNRELKAAGSPAGAPPSQASLPAYARRLEAYREIIERHSRLHRLDPDLVRAVIYAESGGNHRAVSVKGASGLMQLMPATAAAMGAVDVFDPEQNIASGTRYLRVLLDRFQRLELALWAYNAGPTAVEQRRLPRETENYVPKVLRLRRDFKKSDVD
jgi:soluble lytic murein transglycosylase-like protein